MNDVICIDIIVVIVSVLGVGGVGLLCLFGLCVVVIVCVLGVFVLWLCYVYYVCLCDVDGEVIDDGIVLWFLVLNSFIGEEVVELQGYGSLVLLQ